MTDALISALELPAGESHTGFRLSRIEVFNWGTFDRTVWTVEPAGQTTLLTGDIGSGKSTMVDAITTLLLPAHRISYNKAAGADIKERTLRSYVEGHYKSERNEATGSSRPVGLRDHRSYSVVLGVFENVGFDETVTLAQVFHQKDRAGQPDRFFVTAATALSIVPDFTEFGTDLRALRARLRQAGATIDTTFPDYHKRVRRMLGIRSEQAMELFHQTVSMKSVGNLNDFVRGHMLEPADASERIRGIIDHFENLTKAHEAVRTATAQLAVLDPIIAAAEKYDHAVARHRKAVEERVAIGPYISEKLLAILGEQIEARRAELATIRGEIERLHHVQASQMAERARLSTERAGVGGDRLAVLEREIPAAEKDRDDRIQTRHRYAGHLERAALEGVADETAFLARRVDVQVELQDVARQRALQRDRQGDLFDRRGPLRQRREELAQQIDRLESGRNNLPDDLIRVRTRLIDGLGIAEDDLPFAGELMDVRDDRSEWRGAAERALNSFAKTLLVPAQHYSRVSRWVNDHHLRAHLVYLRVAERRVRTLPVDRGPGARLVDVIEIEPGTFADFVAAELAHRADHRLVDSVAELEREDRAVTREGLIRDRDRHAKDDRHRAGDARFWVLGRRQEQKIAALTEEKDGIDARLDEIEAEFAELDRDSAALNTRASGLDALAEYDSWRSLDVQGALVLVDTLVAERSALVAGSSELAEIDRRIDELERQAATVMGELGEAHSRAGAAGHDLVTLEDRQSRELDVLAGWDVSLLDATRGLFAALDVRVGRGIPKTIGDCDAVRDQLTASLTTAVEGAQREMNGYTTSIQQQMGEFLHTWKVLNSEMDANIASIAEFRALHGRVQRDDLPRFEEEFRLQLNTNAVRELAQFQNWLRRSADEIHERVDRINEALGAIDYNPGRIIKLIAEPTINQDVRQFRAELRETTRDMLSPDDADAEARFEQVRGLIDKFKGRPNHSDSDRAWTRRVTDVRNWFSFAASEQDRETAEEFEHYTDSDGKSGGQKEKLAYTILAASLAYQFGLEWGVERSRDFRFAVIDEAFGRGSDASTRYALDLFAKLGLQLLIVTPLQKVHVIDSYVSTIGFVDNPTGAASRVHTLTIEEFRERQRSGG
jgi:uncharacterized protein YPO0396